jgi:hypothetical protein
MRELKRFERERVMILPTCGGIEMAGFGEKEEQATARTVELVVEKGRTVAVSEDLRGSSLRSE